MKTTISVREILGLLSSDTDVEIIFGEGTISCRARTAALYLSNQALDQCSVKSIEYDVAKGCMIIDCFNQLEGI